MNTTTKVKWALEADCLQACNCDYGCPCEFEAPPTPGYCEDIRVEHGTGFIFKGADAVSAKECRASAGELTFSYPDKCGFVTQIKYGN